ncbi:MAG: helix-turn-helix transcriptional regulator [Elusimicrobiota bacterium]
MDLSGLEDIKRLLAEPDPLDSVAEAVKCVGAWRSWTLERQIWYLRKRQNMTQAELSRWSGVSQHRISRIEDGADLKLSTLRALWRPLGYEPLVIPDSADFIRSPRIARVERKMSSET